MEKFGVALKFLLRLSCCVKTGFQKPIKTYAIFMKRKRDEKYENSFRFLLDSKLTQNFYSLTNEKERVERVGGIAAAFVLDDYKSCSL